jgi:hypothetical protein
MGSARIGGWVLAGLIVCLTIAVLLLGTELALAQNALERLSLAGTAALVGAAVALYGAVAWRGAQEGGCGLLLAWWGTMIGAHLGLGLLIGLLRAALTASPLGAGEAASWAGGICLPLGVLQVGYAVGVAAVAYGKGDAAVVEPAAAAEAPHPPTTPPPGTPPPDAARAAHLGVYATAIGKLRAADHASLLRFAAQAAQCKGGVLATRTGQLVACVEVDGLDATRVATVLPKLIDDVDRPWAAPHRGAGLARAGGGPVGG